MHHRDVELPAGRANDTVRAARGRDVVTRVDDALDFVSRFDGMDQALEELSRLVVASVAAAPGNFERLIDLDVRVEQIQDGLHVTASEGLVPATYGINVDLRHASDDSVNGLSHVPARVRSLRVGTGLQSTRNGDGLSGRVPRRYGRIPGFSATLRLFTARIEGDSQCPTTLRLASPRLSALAGSLKRSPSWTPDARPPQLGDSMAVTRAELLQYTGRLTDARELATRLLLKSALEHGSRARCHIVMGDIRKTQGDSLAALEEYRKAAADAERGGDREQLCRAQLSVMLTVGETRDGAQALLTLLPEVRRNVAAAGDPHLTAALHIYVGQIETQRNLMPRARQHFRIAASLLSAHPNEYLQGSLAIAELCVDYLDSEFERAFRQTETARQFVESSGHAGMRVADAVQSWASSAGPGTVRSGPRERSRRASTSHQPAAGSKPRSWRGSPGCGWLRDAMRNAGDCSDR